MNIHYFKLKPILAETLATFGLVFFCGMASMHTDAGNLDLLGVGFANFLILTFMVYISFTISGAHLNPAVTIGFVVTRKMKLIEGFYYIVAQLSGSLIAAISLAELAGDNLLTSAQGKSELGFPHLSSGYGIISGVVLESLLTFFLVFVIWTVVNDDRLPTNLIGFAVGGTVGFNVLVGGSLTGAAMNPARVFGPALYSLDFSHHWIYWIGPIFGGLIAAIGYNYVFLEESEENQTGPMTIEKVNVAK